jgi:isopenicillin N synthase-like dioxygenase
MAATSIPALPLLPVIDISPLLQPDASEATISAVDQCLGQACTEIGFFYIVGHGIPVDLQNELQSASAKFFSLDIAVKHKVAMAVGGKAWRGKLMHCIKNLVRALIAPYQGGSPLEMN